MPKMARTTEGPDASAPSSPSCKGLPSHADLAKALKASVAPAVKNGGFDLQMWATLVDRDGFVCSVAFTGGDRGDQWPGSRDISAQKANTANAFSLPHLALSTANLYTAVQPGGSLFGLQASNPSIRGGLRGNATDYGRPKDPMVGKGSVASTCLAAGLGFTPVGPSDRRPWRQRRHRAPTTIRVAGA